MTFVVVDTGGALHVRREQPTAAAITREVGEPGWAMARLGGSYCGFVNDVGHQLGLPRNVVGTCLLVALAGGFQPYAGPVVITGWHPYRELDPLDAVGLETLRIAHADVRIALGLDQGELSEVGASVAGWAEQMQLVAAVAADGPTPTLRVVRLP